MQELVFTHHLLARADQEPDALAVADGAHRATRSEHLDRVLRLVDGMRGELGLTAGDPFAVLSLNSHRHLELYHAALLGAGVMTPLNLRFAPAEMVHAISDSGARVCFVDATFLPLVERIREQAGLERVVLLTGDAQGSAVLDYEQLLAGGEPAVPDAQDEEAPALLMYTGGTTGLPKGVVLPQRAVVLTSYKLASVVPEERDRVHLVQVPMFHVAALGAVLAAGTAGTFTTVPFFEPAAVLDAVERESVTATMMVPTMVKMLLDSPAYRPERLASLRISFYGASPMPMPLLERLRRDLPALRLFQGYGMTETAALLTVLTPEDHDAGGERLASVGRPVLGAALSIRDAAGEPLPRGEVGEVWARAGNIMSGYWRRPDATADALADGWYHTGDAGRLDDAGYLYLVDRVKDMIITGGENVYSGEVEQALATHPAVQQVAVIGVPDDTWGEAVHAVVVVAPGTDLTLEDLRDHARDRIAGYKLPRSMELRTEPLPLSGAMKVLKRELREPHWAGRERRVN